MIFKLRTSSKTQNVFQKVNIATGLQPFVLSKIAIALSLREGPLKEEDYHTDNTGLELNRQTIFGDTELMFKSLISCSEKRSLTDDEYFPRMVKAHLDRGAKLLDNEARYSKNLYTALCQLDENL